MAERNRLLCPLLAALLALFALFASAPVRAADGAVIVTDVRGDARLANGMPIELLRELPADAELRLQPSARVVLIHMAAGTSYELVGPGRFAVRARQVQSLDAAAQSPRSRVLPPAFRDVRLQSARITQASVAMRGASSDGRLQLLEPVSTWLFDPPKLLAWHVREGNAESAFAVQMTDADNRVVYEASTHDSRIALPQHLRFEPGQLYGWQVRARVGGKLVEAWTEFGVADAALRARAESARPGAGASDADLVAYALLLEALNLRQAAQEQWLHAARARPDDARLRALAEPR
jgi:hypothetical protein